MTATQPAFTAASKALSYGWNPVEISSEPETMAEALRRTHIELPDKDQTCTWEDIADRMHISARKSFAGLIQQRTPATCLKWSVPNPKKVFTIYPHDFAPRIGGKN